MELVGNNDVFERRTSTGSGPFLFLDDCFAQIFSQIVTIIVKKLSNTNFISSRHIKREKSSLPVDVRCSKTPLLKLTINAQEKRGARVSLARAVLCWAQYFHALTFIFSLISL